MFKLTQPLIDEHHGLMEHVESIRIAGDDIYEGMLTKTSLKNIDDVYDFLIQHLIPHAQAEDKVLYPVVQNLMGSIHSTATMSRDHEEIASLSQQLATIRSEIVQNSLAMEQANDLRRVLYGIYTLVKVHFAKEEEIYLPLLESRLSAEEADTMFDALETATHAPRRITHHSA